MIGAWRKRFEEEAVKAADTGEAAAATATAAANPKPAKPDAGRAIETEAADTPAKRVKEGEAPVSAAERKEAADPAKTTRRAEPKGDVPAPQSDKSYVATPASRTPDGQRPMRRRHRSPARRLQMHDPPRRQREQARRGLDPTRNRPEGVI